MASDRQVNWRRRLLRSSAALLTVLILAALTAWLFPEQLLTVDSGPVKADVLVVLGGGWPDRPERAAELFREDEAPKVLVSGFGDDLLNERRLEKMGVPAADITLENKSRTTRQNAEFSVPILRRMGAKRVIIVTSWYHSRRALHCFEHYGPDIKFYSRPSYFGYLGKIQDGRLPVKAGGFTPDNSSATSRAAVSPAEVAKVQARRRMEWKQVRGHAESEYLKLLGYWVCYGVCPF